MQIYADDYGDTSDHFSIIADLTIVAEKVPLRIHVQTQEITPDTVRVLNGLIGNTADFNKINFCSDVSVAVLLCNDSVKSVVLSVALFKAKLLQLARGSVCIMRSLVK